MENNAKNYYDSDCAGDSLGAAIRQVAYPFDSLQEKVDVITEKYHNNFYISDKVLSQPELEATFKLHFKAYYEDKATYNWYGLTVVEPF